jgi:hypothetical protein
LERFDPPDFAGLDSDDDLLSAGLLAGAGLESPRPELPFALAPVSFEPDVSFADDELSLGPDELSLGPDELSLDSEELSLDAVELSVDALAPSPPLLSDFGATPRCAFLP